MNSSNKILFIINKFSGGGYRPELEGRIIDECIRLNKECSIEFTQSRGHATYLAKNAAQENKFDVVFAVGGDGTVNEVAQGLVGSSVTMGILPKGSGNGLGRHLGISTDFKKALQLIGSEKSFQMDTLSVNGKLSVNVSGIGFDGHIAGLFGKNGRRGLIGYTKLVLKEFFTYQEFSGQVTIDGHVHERQSFIIALANSSQFGNNARVAPHASVCDEWMDVSFIKKVPLTQAVGFGQKMFTGNLTKSAFVEIVKAKKIDLQFRHPIAYHIDGEPFEPTDRFTVEIKPGTLKMLLPSNAKGVY
ncbi:MAG: diacylglycerol/lipid kinase family protein [Flammeovirgaceae bacterium]